MMALDGDPLFFSTSPPPPPLPLPSSSSSSSSSSTSSFSSSSSSSPSSSGPSTSPSFRPPSSSSSSSIYRHRNSLPLVFRRSSSSSASNGHKAHTHQHRDDSDARNMAMELEEEGEAEGDYGYNDDNNNNNDDDYPYRYADGLAPLFSPHPAPTPTPLQALRTRISWEEFQQLPAIDSSAYLKCLWFKGKKFVISDVQYTHRGLLRQEDTDLDLKITKDDVGPKMFPIHLGIDNPAETLAAQTVLVCGTYNLSVLLQELTIAMDRTIFYNFVLDPQLFTENPIDRLGRLIREMFWDNLTRSVDEVGLSRILNDSKKSTNMVFRRIYVPCTDIIAIQYYDRLALKYPELEIIKLPPTITPDYVYSLNAKPGILSLALRVREGGQGTLDDLEGCPFVVPGGRFNEMYGWDSYFESLGLLLDGRLDLAKSMADNFVYEISHYGLILNANRSYYLTRSQPPFLTDLAFQVYNHLPRETPAENLEWLRTTISAAIREYDQVWMSPPRYTPETGLSRYFDSGIGMPIETEESHFDAILFKIAQQHDMGLDEFKIAYLNGAVRDDELDCFFVHDRSVRESGHDTTYRLEGRSAFLNTVDLNCLLYKYEYQIGEIIRDLFNDSFLATNGQIYNSTLWFERAESRRRRIFHYCLDEGTGFFYDYDFETKERVEFKAATIVYTLWSGLATIDQARRIVEGPLVLLEEAGGLVGCTADSLEGVRGPNRQWDYPFGWPPHQMLAWAGLLRYGYREIAERLAYRWLYMVLQSFVDYNGTVPEKFNVVRRSCHVFVEYGNVGTDFAYVSREGFGWMNASIQVGLKLLSPERLADIRLNVAPEDIYPPLSNLREA